MFKSKRHSLRVSTAPLIAHSSSVHGEMSYASDALTEEDDADLPQKPAVVLSRKKKLLVLTGLCLAWYTVEYETA